MKLLEIMQNGILKWTYGLLNSERATFLAIAKKKSGTKKRGKHKIIEFHSNKWFKIKNAKNVVNIDANKLREQWIRN